MTPQFGALLPPPQAKIFDSPLSEYIGKCISEVGECPAKRGLLLEVYFMRMIRPAVRLALLEGEMCIFIKYLLEYLALSTSIRRFAVDNFWQTSVPMEFLEIIPLPPCFRWLRNKGG